MFKKGPRGGGRTFKHFVFVYIFECTVDISQVLRPTSCLGGHEPKSIAAYIHKSGAYNTKKMEHKNKWYKFGSYT